MTNEDNRFFIKKIVVVNVALVIIQDMYEKGEITKKTRDIYFKGIKEEEGLN